MPRFHRPSLLQSIVLTIVIVVAGASWGTYRVLRSVTVPSNEAQESIEKTTETAQPTPVNTATPASPSTATATTPPTTSATATKTTPPKSTTVTSPAPTTPTTPTTPTPTPTQPPAQPSGTCTNPFFTTSNSNGGVNSGGYYVHNNLWNASSYPGTTGTTQVCSYNSWNHIAYAVNNGDGAVKTYPNVHKDFSGRTVASFTTLSSSFAAISPNVGIYNVAYDLWLNGIPNDEIMIWTDNRNQVPAGSKFASNVALSGYTWNIYATGGNGYIAFVPANGARITSGTINIKALLDYLVTQGRISASSTVDQIGYGIEIVDTGGAPATWYVTNFNLSHN